MSWSAREWQSEKKMSDSEFASRAQVFLTRGFMLGLVATVGLLGFALIESFGQTVYARWAENNFAFPALWTGLTGAGIAFTASRRNSRFYLEKFLGAKNSGCPSCGWHSASRCCGCC